MFRAPLLALLCVASVECGLIDTLLAAKRFSLHESEESGEVVSNEAFEGLEAETPLLSAENRSLRSAPDWTLDLEDRLEDAEDMMKTAINKLRKGDKKTLALAKKWFGSNADKDAGIKKELLRVMSSSLHVISNFKGIKKNCDPETYAYVFPEKHRKGQKFEMILCPLYFKSKPKVQLETLVHEGSHHKDGLLDDVCLDSIESHGRHQRETKEFIVISQNLVKKYSKSKKVHPDLQFEIDLTDVLHYWFVDPVTLEVLEDDDEDDEDEYVHEDDDDYDEDYDYDEDEADDEFEDVPAVVHRIVDVKIGGKMRKDMALVQLDPADDCDDKAYGRKECAALAKSSPVKALRNADNFCYFIIDASSGSKASLAVAEIEETVAAEASAVAEEFALGLPCACSLGEDKVAFQQEYQKAVGGETALPKQRLTKARRAYMRICGC